MNGNNNHQNDPVRDLVDDIIQKISTENDNVYISVSRITKITIVLNDFRQGEARIGLEARTKLEAKKRKVHQQIYQERIKLVKGCYANSYSQIGKQLCSLGDGGYHLFSLL